MRPCIRNGTHVCIEYLRLTEYGMGNEDARGRFTDEPVAGEHVDGRAIERVWVDGGCKYGEAREDHEACSERTASASRLASENEHQTRTHL